MWAATPGRAPRWRPGCGALPETVALLLVVGVGVGLGLVLLIVPGVWLGTIWGLALPVLVIERTGVFGALGRSRALVSGRFWAVLGLLVLAFLVTLFSAGLVGAIAGAFAAAAGADAEAAGAVGALVSGVASMVFAVPVASSMLFVMYVDQRVRGEGLTMPALARELGVAGAVPESAPASPGPELPGGWRPPRAGG